MTVEATVVVTAVAPAIVVIVVVIMFVAVVLAMVVILVSVGSPVTVGVETPPVKRPGASETPPPVWPGSEFRAGCSEFLFFIGAIMTNLEVRRYSADLSRYESYIR